MKIKGHMVKGRHISVKHKRKSGIPVAESTFWQGIYSLVLRETKSSQDRPSTKKGEGGWVSILKK